MQHSKHLTHSCSRNYSDLGIIIQSDDEPAICYRYARSFCLTVSAQLANIHIRNQQCNMKLTNL